MGDTSLSIVLWAALLLSFLSDFLLVSSTPSTTRSFVQERSQHLISFASQRKKPTICPTSVRYLSSQNLYGRTGNRWMQYGNLLWLAETLNFTVFISTKEKSLQYFNLSALASSFCVTTSLKQLPSKLTKQMSVKPVTVHSYSHMNAHFRGVNSSQLLPHEEDHEVRIQHAEVMLTFFAALFGSMKESVITLGTSFLEQSHISINQYVAIHKRHFELQCAGLLFQHFNFSDFSENDFNKSISDWQQVLRQEQLLQQTDFYNRDDNHLVNAKTKSSVSGSESVSAFSLLTFHPLCNMTPAVVLGAQQANSLTKLSSYVLLTDHQEPVPAYLQTPPVNASLIPKEGKDGSNIMVDLFLGLHSALLIRNPYSTLTLPVDLLRIILNLPTSSVDRSSNISLTVLGKWLTMSDVRDALERMNHVALY